MKIHPLIAVFIPFIASGKSARFRACLRLRELFRKRKLWFFADCVKGYLYTHFGCEISVNAQISTKAMFMHTVGVVVGEGCVIEDGVIIYSGVCLGRKDINTEKYPIIKKNAVLCTGSIVLGKVTVGEGCVIGANSLVIIDCEPNKTYVGSPAKCLK